MALLTWPNPRNASWMLPVFAAYSATLAITTWFHESWFDEAQAWLMARDSSLFQLWFSRLRYEGTPGLWHTLLFVLAKIGLPYGSMHVASCLAASAAAGLLLWRAPFPRIVRALFPFTYFLLYQYAVIARSYSLIPVVLFLTALVLPDARRRTALFVLLLLLMANISVQGTLAAMGILAAYFADLWTDRKRLSPGEVQRHAIGFAVLAIGMIVLVAQLWPPNDLTFFPVAPRDLARQRFDVSRAASLLGQALSVDDSYAFAEIVLSGLVLVLSLRWFHEKGTLLYFVLPAGAVLALSGQVYSNKWHAGVLFLLWLFAMWLSAGRSQELTPAYVWLVWILVLVPHLCWSAMTVAFDLRHPYSGSRAAAEYLKSHELQDRVVFGAGRESISLQPYFRRNLFRNYNGGEQPAFWLWSKSNDFPLVMSSIPSSRPDALVVALNTPEQFAAASQLVRSLPQSGYILAGRFNGYLYWKASVLESESFLVIHKNESRQ